MSSMNISLRSATRSTMSDSNRGPAQHRGRRLAALVVGATLAAGAFAATPALADGPPAIQPPGGNTKYLTLHAQGVQNYTCKVDYKGQIGAWTFVGPQANLFDSSGSFVGTHYLDPATQSPSWNLWDGSRVVATKVASTPSPIGAIPWLLLQVTDQYTTWNMFNGFNSYVQRVNTVGGQPPAIACDWFASRYTPNWGSSYSADYVFYYYFG